MMLRNVVGPIVLLNLCVTVCVGQEIVSGNKIAIGVSVKTQRVDGFLVLDYILGNSADAKQDVIEFSLITDSAVTVKEKIAPSYWRVSSLYDDDLMIRWFAKAKDDVEGHLNAINPGKTLAGFSLRTNSLVGIIAFYAEGDHPLPKFPPGMAPDSIPGYDDLTPYGAGVVGKTVGPVLPPDPFIAASFLDTLASYKHQAFALGWITNKGILNSLDQKLDNARKQLERGNTKAAKNILGAFINEVDAQKDKHLSSEAYALLKYNAEYLIEKLEEQITKKK